ncbi:HypC/HybG/HupF family hydrogenase formation chaperone [Corynebacterium sp. 153RC1]|uniref:HypC/HybG/HupF family hydrogenase formation chaperone n=1 Tax=unclassified Corynebacterium TaxID=2624378 RepID=UPI00211BF75C|nr:MULTISPECIES: HypC/HybG/HupF family hydrogenase formation chaperone [unclassified Corynebacterium]MCQ9370715.1 HypC/HybG/HupF family hydrogenase formation chaperone [Corynebacterium sp. 35RC1]MCQ9352647.1 HypC/HybG/HupF family hydrogenase formation chaperone [Corynebacterium sp. 209RC1]MCQ9354831.1 HypC/HybG/HupF family hydrogenase formation chaperone [Corynebacterium sp. 1222RC1]MCQ9357016.1 HypC/HybG/HupF family hydrogenase formation chaperone [Corynebacterium sp. 122RC1]MCQ9359099.1 HypC
MCLGIPAKVIELGPTDDPLPMGVIDVMGQRRPCCFAYVPEVQVGDWVLIQNSFAMTIVDESSARESLATIEEFDLIDNPPVNPPH